MNGGPLRPATYPCPTPEQAEALVRDIQRADPSMTREVILRVAEEERRKAHVYLNDLYQVAVRFHPDDGSDPQLIHLSIKRVDRQPIHDWRDLQDIKTALVGPECEGVELYPAESRVVDTANQFHLWVVADPTFRFPFGFPARFVDYSDVRESGAQQRPRSEV